MMDDSTGLLWVPFALLAGFGFHRVLSQRPAVSTTSPKVSRQLQAIVLPLGYLIVWVMLCFGFKLLTWKPFAGDVPGSVAATQILILAGSALTGVWMSARLRR